MKAKLVLLTALLCFAGCSLIWSPSATVKKFMAAAEQGDVETMTSLFSHSAIQKMGLDQIKSNNQSLSDLIRRAPVAAGSYRMEDIVERPTPAGRQVSFRYKNAAEAGSLGLMFDLSKESGNWKIDNLSSPGVDDNPNLISPKDFELEVLPSPPPLPSRSGSGVVTVAPAEPPLAVNGQPEATPAGKVKTISGGVLNGKAISLPKPLYPPIAKAAKASGTVTIQVLVDEQGNVVSAHAVSGHPLLQATAITAARAAKFTPTKLSGQTVKVNGVIIYNFTPE